MNLSTINLSKREKGLITLLVAVAVFGSYIFYLLIPTIDQYRENRKVLDIQNQLVDQLESLQNNQQFLLEEQDVTYEWNNLDSIVPSEFKMPVIYNELMKIKNDAKVNYSSLTFNPPEVVQNNQTYGSKSLNQLIIQISLTGSYENIKNYLKLLYDQSREYTISDFSLATEGENLRASFTAMTYALISQNNTQEEETADYSPMEGDNNGNENPYAGNGE